MTAWRTSSGLCNDPDRWHRAVGGGKEAREGGSICIHVADSHLWTAETNTHCKGITLQLKSIWKPITSFHLQESAWVAKHRVSSENPRGAADPAAPLPQLLHLVRSEPKAAWSVPSRGYAKWLVTKLTPVLESESTADVHAIGSLRLLFHSLRKEHHSSPGLMTQMHSFVWVISNIAVSLQI